MVSRETRDISDDALRLFRLQLEHWGIRVEATRLDKMVEYARQLVAYDRANITGAKTPSEALLNHVLDSLSCFLVGKLSTPTTLIDVGSGGGLPGLPLKLAFPTIDLTMMEATGRKVEFLQGVLQSLESSGARVVNDRAEDAGQSDEHRESYEIVTARAVASLPVLAEYCLPLVQAGGVVLAMKGRMEREELEAGQRAAARLGGELAEVVEVPFISEIWITDHRLVVIEKVGRTPAQYPRRTGRPSKRPLG